MRNTELNTPREMGVRFLFVVTLGLGAAGLFFSAIGLLQFFSGHGVGFALLGLGLVTFARLMTGYGRRHWDFKRLDTQFARDLSGEHCRSPELEDKISELAKAEEDLLAYQARYQEADYDIMRVQVLRQRIRLMIRQDGRLREHLRPDIVI